MIDNKNKQNDINECKTEYLFESDEEKVILKNACKPKKNYKRFILLTLFFSFIIIITTVYINILENKEIKKLNATISELKNSKNNLEKLNNSSNKLKKYDSKVENKYEKIINKANPISEEECNNYEQVLVKNNIFNEVYLEKETYKNYLDLKNNLLERGYYINVRSGYRSFNESKKLFIYYENANGKSYANKYVAKEGTSEHNTGLALDILISKDKYATKNNYESDEYFYLENIAYLYGFIIRYPKGKEDITGYNYEPWHLRYVGKEFAKYLKKSNLTLEEYYN